MTNSLGTVVINIVMGFTSGLTTKMTNRSS